MKFIGFLFTALLVACAAGTGSPLGYGLATFFFLESLDDIINLSKKP